MWTQQVTDAYANRVKWYSKKRDRELVAVLANLDQYFKSLVEGAKPLQVHFGFMHPEPLGVVAIDQKGGGKGLAQTRLYVYPEASHRILHLLTLGDKNTQKADLATCRQYVTELRKTRENEDQKEAGDKERDP